MRLSTKGLALTAAITWAGSILCVGFGNLAAPSYGTTFLQVLASLYPGFHNSRHFADVLVAAGYGLVDGGIGGLIFAWVYNCFVPRAPQIS